MENLKKLIESVEKQSNAISNKIKLVNASSKFGGYKIQSKEGYHGVYFEGDQADKVRALIESFIAEDEKICEPSLDKLNTISRLIGKE